MSVRFDAAGAIAELRLRLTVAMRQLQEEFLAEAQSHMNTREGADDLWADDMTDVAGIIAAQVIGGPWAVMDEFGAGSLMDRDNPALPEYMASEMWNPLRGKHGPDDTAIRTRPPGQPYTDIFGQHQVGRAAVGGINLEAIGVVEPQPPSRALRTAARWMQNGRFQRVLRQTLAEMPWHRFVIVDGG